MLACIEHAIGTNSFVHSMGNFQVQMPYQLQEMRSDDHAEFFRRLPA
jgi:hypothetical protein